MTPESLEVVVATVLEETGQRTENQVISRPNPVPCTREMITTVRRASDVSTPLTRPWLCCEWSSNPSLYLSCEHSSNHLCNATLLSVAKLLELFLPVLFNPLFYPYLDVSALLYPFLHLFCELCT